MPSSIHILGAGAIGLLHTSHLLKQGMDCTLITKTFQSSKTFSINSQLYHCKSQLASHSSKIENLLICTKSYDVKSAFASIQKRIQKDSNVILICNGSLSIDLPHFNLIHGVTTHGVALESQNTYVHSGTGTTIFGSLKSHPISPEVAQIIQAMETLNSAWSLDIHESLALKHCVNAFINPLTAVLDIQNGKLSDQVKVLEIISEELSLVFPQFVASQIKREIQTVIRNTASNSSSMLMDLRAGRRTENEEIGGWVLSVAKELNVRLPVLNTLYEIVKMKESLSNCSFRGNQQISGGGQGLDNIRGCNF